MTSLAVFSPLKRTITDIMEDDLYHLPNSSGSNLSMNSQQQPQQQQQYQPQQQQQQQQQPAGRMNVASFPQQQQQQSSLQQFPSIHQTTQQHTPTLTSAQLSYMFNSIPDSYIAPYSLDANDQQQQQQQQHNNVITPDQVFSGTTVKSPFADYANPDSQFSNFFGYNNVNNSSNPTPTTRRRFTTLESHSNEKPIKDEDYYLFNTDIQPSHLVAKNDDVNLSNDDFLYLNTPLYVPPKQTQEFPIPGYENDYLMMSGVEDLEEDIEDPISSDEEDEDNYFHDDFDEMIMNDLPQPVANDFGQNQNVQQNVFPQVEQLNQDHLFNRPSSITSSSMTSVPTTGSTFNDNSSFDRLVFSSQDTTVMPSLEDIKLGNDEDDEDYGNTQETTPELQDLEVSPLSNGRELHNHFEALSHKSAAEITANNPNHQCDLINPSTRQPCNKQFSRPYDLIRHQETIHASKKKIFRCVICEGRLNGGPGNGKLKTFSRGDALSRHIKVKHGLAGDEAIELINNAKANVEFISV